MGTENDTNNPNNGRRAPFVRQGSRSSPTPVRTETAAHHNEYQLRAQYIEAAEKASQRHPEIPQQVFIDLIAAYDAERDAYAARLRDLRARNLSQAEYQVEFGRAVNDSQAAVRQRITQHGAMADAALHAIAEQSAPESFFTPAVRMVYNSDRGGIQVGGAVGAAAGGGLGYYLTRGSSWFVKAIGIVGGTLAGAFAGSSFFPGKANAERPNFKTAMPARNPNATPTPPASKLDPKPEPYTPGSSLQVNANGIEPAPLRGTEAGGFYPEGGPSIRQSGEVKVHV
jgi:hypothetical protein